jgi:hypothetical protein
MTTLDSSIRLHPLPPEQTGVRPLIRWLAGIAICLAFGWYFLGPMLRQFVAFRSTTCTVDGAAVESEARSQSYSENKRKREVRYWVWKTRLSFRYAVDGTSFTCADQNILMPELDCTPLLAAERAEASRSGSSPGAGLRRDPLLRLLPVPEAYSEAKVRSLIERFAAGTTHTCWHDAAVPRAAVLQRRIEWFHWILAAVTGLGIAAFTADLYVARRRRHAVEPELGFRLAPKSHVHLGGTRVGGLLGMLFVCGFIGIFVYLVWFFWLVGHRPILLTLIVSPFALLGVVILGSALYDFVTLRLGRVVVEVDAETIRPGEPLRVRVVQPGPAKLRSFWVSLVAEESKLVRVRSKGRERIRERKEVRHRERLIEPRRIWVPAGQAVDLRMEAFVPVLETEARPRWKLIVSRRGWLVPLLPEEFALRMSKEA